MCITAFQKSVIIKIAKKRKVAKMLPFCLTKSYTRGIIKVLAFKESEHPRDKDGKYILIWAIRVN